MKKHTVKAWSLFGFLLSIVALSSHCGVDEGSVISPEAGRDYSEASMQGNGAQGTWIESKGKGDAHQLQIQPIDDIRYFNDRIRVQLKEEYFGEVESVVLTVINVDAGEIREIWALPFSDEILEGRLRGDPWEYSLPVKMSAFVRIGRYEYKKSEPERDLTKLRYFHDVTYDVRLVANNGEIKGVGDCDIGIQSKETTSAY